jgi:aldehyde:ferredoxin oxidoreductase
MGQYGSDCRPHQKMVNREGIGDILADGSKVAAAKIGRVRGRVHCSCGRSGTGYA